MNRYIWIFWIRREERNPWRIVLCRGLLDYLLVGSWEYLHTLISAIYRWMCSFYHTFQVLNGLDVFVHVTGESITNTLSRGGTIHGGNFVIFLIFHVCIITTFWQQSKWFRFITDVSTENYSLNAETVIQAISFLTCFITFVLVLCDLYLCFGFIYTSCEKSVWTEL